MVVGAVCADAMHVQAAEILIDPGVQQFQQGLPGSHRHLAGVWGDLAALAGVRTCDVVEVQLRKELLQLIIGHAVEVLTQPVDLCAILQIAAEAGRHEIGVVDVGFQAHKCTLVEV